MNSMNVKQVGDEYRTCPFNTSHQILTHRFQTHIVKCKRNYPDSNLQECRYNSTHFIRRPNIRYLDKNKTVPFSSASSGNVQGSPAPRQGLDRSDSVDVDKYSVRHLEIDTGETWEEVPTTYDPQKYCTSQPVLRKLDTASSAKRRDFRLEERKRFNELIENKKSENNVLPGEGPPRIRRPQKASEVYPSVLEDRMKKLNINADVTRPIKTEKPVMPPIESKPVPIRPVTTTKDVKQESPWNLKAEEEEFKLVTTKRLGRGRGRHVANTRLETNERL